MYKRQLLCLGEDLLLVQGEDLAVLHHQFAVDDGVVDIAGGDRLHQGADQVVGGEDVGLLDVDEDDVGLLARLQAAQVVPLQQGVGPCLLYTSRCV